MKEVAEETGIPRTGRLLAVLDGMHMGLHPHPLYSFVFHCKAVGGELTAHPLETVVGGLFAEDALPEPTAGAQLWGPAAFAAIRGEPMDVLFDRPLADLARHDGAPMTMAEPCGRPCRSRSTSSTNLGASRLAGLVGLEIVTVGPGEATGRLPVTRASWPATAICTRRRWSPAGRHAVPLRLSAFAPHGATVMMLELKANFVGTATSGTVDGRAWLVDGGCTTQVLHVRRGHRRQ